MTTAATAARPHAAEHVAILRALQYNCLPTPIYCWQHDGKDFVLRDYNDAANDLTYGYIGALLDRRAGEIYHQRPQALADLEQCLRGQTMIVRHAALWHPGLLASIPGLARYIFAPPDLVIVQVQLDPTPATQEGA